uniref:Putative secreted protein n=1 Tax=Ixodes ricinus TaxID=34613 RepID=A0A6B0U8E5_IXORI
MERRHFFFFFSLVASSAEAIQACANRTLSGRSRCSVCHPMYPHLYISWHCSRNAASTGLRKVAAFFANRAPYLVYSSYQY